MLIINVDEKGRFLAAVDKSVSQYCAEMIGLEACEGEGEAITLLRPDIYLSSQTAVMIDHKKRMTTVCCHHENPDGGSGW